jgi:hypothetical protein
MPKYPGPSPSPPTPPASATAERQFNGARPARQFAVDRPQRAAQNPVHRPGQLLAVTPRQLEPGPGMRIGVAPAPDRHHDDCARMIAFQILLCITRPVAANLVELARHRGAMAGVTRHQPPQPPVFAPHHQHRHIVTTARRPACGSRKHAVPSPPPKPPRRPLSSASNATLRAPPPARACSARSARFDPTAADPETNGSVSLKMGAE